MAIALPDARRPIALVVGVAATVAFVVLRVVVALVGGAVGMIVVGLILILLFLWRRRRSDAATLAIAVIVVVAIGAPMAAVIARTRPADSLAERMATSFPSGHTAVATTVVAGLLEGIAVATLVWVAVEAVRDRRAARTSSPEPSMEGTSRS